MIFIKDVSIKNVIRKWGKRAVHQLELLFEILQNHRLGRRTRYAYYYKYIPVSRKTILYESFYGRGMLCGPYAIFLELLDEPKYSKYQHVWVLDKLENHAELIREYDRHRNVRFVEYQSKKYMRYLCRAGYLFNNSTFPDYYTKKKGQIYVNTWHGIPLKTLGYDMPNGKTEVANTVRNMLLSDYMVSANPFLTQVYLDAYKLHQLYQGGIIEEGYPRLDLLKRFTREQVFDKLRRYGMEVDEEKSVILYAPTWKGKSYGNPDTGVEEYFAFKNRVEMCIDTSRYQILIKVHQRVFQLAKDRLKKGWFVPASIDANEILSVTDILISDYSSIFYDFLATGRPILFYIQDIGSYREQRGLYRTPDTLPGPCTDDIEELTGWISAIGQLAQRYKNKTEEQARWADAIHNENISRKIIDIVFEKKEEAYAVQRQKPQKTKILISRGEMRVNGISTSLINLLNNMDYDKWDVTLMITNAKNQNEREFVDKINKNVRVMLRGTTFNMTYIEQIRHKYYMKYGVKNPYQEIYRRELRRAYADAAFDYVIDFEGYNYFYSLLALQSVNTVKGIWLHNDMMSEKERRFPWLTNIFGLYRYFDVVVSCSREIMEVNREALSGYCDRSRFRYAKNTIDTERIESGLLEDCLCKYQGKTWIRIDEGGSGCKYVKMIPFVKDAYSFVNMARLSVEKNQENLILAVSRLAQEGADIYLYILGDGPLKGKFSKLVTDLGLDGRVIMAGNVKNPFAVMRYCDCFVLPSLHEGQPMVIHEARAMHMPVILSDFDSVSGVSIENGQYLTGKEVDDIYEGLKAYIDGRVPTDYLFDVNEYNKEAYREFLTALGADGAGRKTNENKEKNKICRELRGGG